MMAYTAVVTAHAGPCFQGREGRKSTCLFGLGLIKYLVFGKYYGPQRKSSSADTNLGVWTDTKTVVYNSSSSKDNAEVEKLASNI